MPELAKGQHNFRYSAMMKIILILTLSTALAGCSGFQTSCATPDAQGIVDAARPEEQLRSMLRAGAERSQTFRNAIARDRAAATQNLSAAIDRAVERHSAEWRRNIVAAWQGLSPTELNQVCTAINRRDEQLYTQYAARIGPDVQRRNEPLLIRAGGQVLVELMEVGRR